MAGLRDMSKLLVVLMVLGTCRAQAPLGSQEPVLISAPECTYTPPETTKDSCPTILAVNTNRTSIGNDTLRFKTRFGFKGKLNTGITQATLVIGPLPASLTVEKMKLSCQRKRDCVAVPPCVTSDKKIVATVKVATVMELRVTFPSEVDNIRVTGELSTSCGETVPLEWLKGNPIIIDGPVILGPEPSAAPSGADIPVGLEAASPANPTVEVPVLQAAAPAPDAGA